MAAWEAAAGRGPAPLFVQNRFTGKKDSAGLQSAYPQRLLVFTFRCIPRTMRSVNDPNG